MHTLTFWNISWKHSYISIERWFQSIRLQKQILLSYMAQHLKDAYIAADKWRWRWASDGFNKSSTSHA